MEAAPSKRSNKPSWAKFLSSNSQSSGSSAARSLELNPDTVFEDAVAFDSASKHFHPENMNHENRQTRNRRKQKLPSSEGASAAKRNFNFDSLISQDNATGQDATDTVAKSPVSASSARSGLNPVASTSTSVSTPRRSLRKIRKRNFSVSVTKSNHQTSGERNIPVISTPSKRIEKDPNLTSAPKKTRQNEGSVMGLRGRRIANAREILAAKLSETPATGEQSNADRISQSSGASASSNKTCSTATIASTPGGSEDTSVPNVSKDELYTLLRQAISLTPRFLFTCTERGLPEGKRAINKPMDLWKIMASLEKNEITTVAKLDYHFRLLFFNAFMTYRLNHEYNQQAIQAFCRMNKLFKGFRKSSRSTSTNDAASVAVAVAGAKAAIETLLPPLPPPRPSTSTSTRPTRPSNGNSQVPKKRAFSPDITDLQPRFEVKTG